ncbi:MAG: hypothetical protein JXR79_00410 [Nitrospirae bacterium]|nr:hypothetical protein [Nitrospirota bacterium]
MSFTGDAETIRFKTILASVLEKNELNGKSPYALYFATKASNSGWSFGVPQYDLSEGNNVNLFRDILINAQVKDNSGNYIYVIDDGDPTTNRANDKKVADLFAKAKSKDSSLLTSTERGLIDKALSSDYGKSAIDNSLDPWLTTLITDANRVIALTSGADKTFLQTDIGKLFLCDYDNQYYIDSGGKLEKFVQGFTVSLGGGTVTKQGTLGVDDLLAFYFRTKQASKTPWDPMRRFSNIVAATGYTPTDLDEAKGVLRAYTYLYVRNENILIQNQTYLDSVNAFRNQVNKPADQVIFANWKPEWGPMPTTYNDILMGNDGNNYNDSGEYQLNGRGGNDIIFGEGGNDHIEGGKGDDILFGGTGHDIYIYSIGDGNDRIIDEDKDGEIVIFDSTGTEINRRVLGNFYKSGQNECSLPDGSTIKVTQNSPTKIVLPDGSTIDLGENFESGDFGINLLDAPIDPDTSEGLVIEGDFTPIDFDLTEPAAMRRAA